MTSLGPSNDDSDAVRMEIRAAEIARQYESGGNDMFSPVERAGWNCHARGHGIAEEHCDAWWSGWLARELVTHGSPSRDLGAWAWDISRPIAEQLAETAADDAAADLVFTPVIEIVGDESDGVP